MFSWWYWSRGDARFVGRWRDSQFDYDIRSSGVVYWGASAARYPRFWEHWKIEGDVLRIGRPLKNRSPHPLRHAYAAWDWVTAQEWSQGYMPPFRIVEISPNKLTLHQFDEETGQFYWPSPFILHRIPE
jgi:hypothetical protein